MQRTRKALNAIKLFKPDLILLGSTNARSGGGFEVCEILNNDQETHGIPIIIIISGFGNLVDIKMPIKLGAVGYLVKPFSG